LLSLFPLSIFISMRRLGFPLLTAGLGAVASPLLSANFLYGFDYGSYVWRGSGLYTQLWGMLLLPLGLGFGFSTLRDGRGYFWAVLFLGATTLAHLAFGYMAFASLAMFAVLAPAREGLWRSLFRLVLIFVPLLLVTSYFLV